MRHWKPILLLALGGSLLCGSAAKAQTRVLFLGNSFTFGAGDASDRAEAVGGVPGIFERLAHAGGKTNLTVVMRAVAGEDYRFHDQDPTSQAAMQAQPWTCVVLQDYSTEPTHLVDGTRSLQNFYTYGTSLYGRAITNNPQTRVILYETWSRAAAHPMITGISGPTSFASTTEFQTELRTHYRHLADLLNGQYPAHPPVVVAPVGDAWENAGGLRSSAAPGFADLFESDNYHGNDNGYYLAAAVFYATIFGAPPQGLGTNALVLSLNLNLTLPSEFLEQVAWSTVHGKAPASPMCRPAAPLHTPRSPLPAARSAPGP